MTEIRSAAVTEVLDVRFQDRIITTIAAPYEQPAPVPGGQGFGRRGEIWNEIFCRSAFAGTTNGRRRVAANRDHKIERTVGKVLQFHDEPQGLIADVKIARTELGDETLALADDHCLGASAGFLVRERDHDLNRSTRTRRIRAAFLEHLAFVPDPAFVGAEVLSVRSAAPFQLADYYTDPYFQWAHARTDQARQLAAHASSQAALADWQSFQRQLSRR